MCVYVVIINLFKKINEFNSVSHLTGQQIACVPADHETPFRFTKGQWVSLCFLTAVTSNKLFFLERHIVTATRPATCKHMSMFAAAGLPKCTALTWGLTQRVRARCQPGWQSPAGVTGATSAGWWETSCPLGYPSVLETWWLAASKMKDGGGSGGLRYLLETTWHHCRYILSIRREF